MFVSRRYNPNVYGLGSLGTSSMLLIAAAAALYFMPSLRRKVFG